MAEHHQTLPPLEWIRVFEAAGRLGSFTAAANELGLTQAAVSQRIKNLELQLGAQLFNRQARGVILSIQGESWLPHVQTALNHLLHSTANLFELPRRKVTIAASSSVIELWIVPRLLRIAQQLPHVQLSFETIQHLPDYERSEADFEIRFGEGNWSGRDAERLYAEELAPVASSVLVNAASGNWETLPRIATSGPRDGWRDWSLATGGTIQSAPTLRFDTFVQALRAAEAGAGVLLASLPLCKRSIQAGSLVCLADRALRMEAGYWVTWPRNRPTFAERGVLIGILQSPIE
ncbi:LysR family transcriptional regulator [Phyllobacterium myrsinacearum]|uniref:LysR family glycine cleavage system transcriptional activator n=1 Tax=Phyllobacterium myrsinacearum TaxID=28101 RepID=A0A839EG18_9HYPH|nr:LysR family transcriptional regulator [Phyllobacterium myrsinacearum]MBA8877235.1 LysR family glycine cleavage system transcriptional activator [Phyllobacterium myrsinacearum]